MFSGLGESYDPFIDRVRKAKRIIFVENDSDWRAIQAIAKSIGHPLTNIEPYPTTESHKDRRKFFQKLEKGIPGIRALSLRDRDGAPLSTVCEETLRDKSDNHGLANFSSRTLRRRELENYALIPDCLARILGIPIPDIQTWWETELALPFLGNALPDSSPVLEGDFKDALHNKLKASGRSIDDLWGEIREIEVHKDLKSLVLQLVDL